MAKTLLGFVAGMILTSVVFLLRDVGSDDAVVPASDPISVQTSGSNSPGPVNEFGDTNEVTDSGEEFAQTRTEATESTLDFREDFRFQRERLLEQFDEAGRAALEALSAQEEASRALRELDLFELLAQPILTFLPLSEEFDWLNAPGWGDFMMNHERIQRETRDELWAAQAEQRLWGILNNQQGFIRDYGQPTITCAATLCEITLLRYGVAAEISYGDFDDLRLAFISNSDYREFFDVSPQWSERNEDDVAALFAILKRREQSSQTQSKIETALN